MALFLAFGLFGLVCYAAIQLALQLQQERVQVVRSTKVVRRIPTKSNGTPAMDLKLEGKCIHIQAKNRKIEQNAHP